MSDEKGESLGVNQEGPRTPLPYTGLSEEQSRRMPGPATRDKTPALIPPDAGVGMDAGESH